MEFHRGACQLILLLMLCCPMDALPQVRVVSIGVVTDLSGVNAINGAQTRIGFVLAQKAARNEGIDLRAVFEDSASDNTKAVSAAQKLLFVDQVDAVYTDYSPSATAMSPLVLQQKRLLMYLGGAKSLLEKNSYAFKSFLDFNAACRRIAEYFQRQDISKTGIVQIQIEATELCADGFKSVFPNSILHIQTNPTEDVASALLAMKNKRVGGILSLSFEAGLGSLLKSVRAYHYGGLIATLPANMGAHVIEQNGSLMPQIVLVGMKSVPNEFAKLWKEQAGKTPENGIEYAALAFVHGQQLVRAVAECQPGDIDCQKEKIGKSPPDVAAGFLGFDNRIASLSQSIRRWRDGKFVDVE